MSKLAIADEAELLRVDIYPVGLLADLLFLRNAVKHLGNGVKLPHVRQAAVRLIREFRSSWSRRSYWNGYLAEARQGGDAGHGWTKRRAYRTCGL